MRLSILAGLAGLSATVAGQLGNLPVCAQQCLTANLNGCDPTNGQCICTNKQLISDLSCCVSKNCTPKEIQESIDYSQSICNSVFHVTTLPTVAGCSKTSGLTAASQTSTASANRAPAVTQAAECLNLAGAILAGAMALM